VIGIGIDLVDVARFERLLARTPEFAERYFTAVERARCEKHHRPARLFAAMFAVKEAFLKSIGTGVLGGVALEDIEVAADGRAFTLRLTGSAARALVARGAARTWVDVADDGRRVWAAVALD
jgi:holo-[acyl-carrier protein] synthase